MNRRPKRAIVIAGAAAFFGLLGTTIWLAVRIKTVERDFASIGEVPLVGQELEPFIPPGAVSAAFYEHPHGGGWGYVSGTCSQEEFRSIAADWNMKMFGKDVPADLMETFEDHMFNQLPKQLRGKVPVAESDIGGIDGQRKIGRVKVRLNGFYFEKTQRFVLDVKYVGHAL